MPATPTPARPPSATATAPARRRSPTREPDGLDAEPDASSPSPTAHDRPATLHAERRADTLVLERRPTARRGLLNRPAWGVEWSRCSGVSFVARLVSSPIHERIKRLRPARSAPVSLVMGKRINFDVRRTARRPSVENLKRRTPNAGHIVMSGAAVSGGQRRLRDADSQTQTTRPTHSRRKHSAQIGQASIRFHLRNADDLGEYNGLVPHRKNPCTARRAQPSPATNVFGQAGNRLQGVCSKISSRHDEQQRTT